MKKCAEKITLQCIFVLVNISPCPCVSPAVNITAFESSNCCVFMPNPLRQGWTWDDRPLEFRKIYEILEYIYIYNN